MATMKKGTDVSDAAWDRVLAEGLRVYEYRRHVNSGIVQYLGRSWEDGGLAVDSEGHPRCDYARNTIAHAAVRDVDRFADAELISEWWG